MAEVLYKQKEFADITGISTATVVKMINTGELEKAPDGKIPKSEIYKVLQNRVKRFASHGALLLNVNGSTADAENLKLFYFDNIVNEKDKDTATCITDVISFYNEASKKSSILSKTAYQERYNRKVLDIFMSKYKLLLKDFINNIYEEKVFGKGEEDKNAQLDYKGLKNLPGVVLRDYICYDKVIYENVNKSKEEIDLEVKAVQSSLNTCSARFNEKFINLMQNLKLTTGNNKFMFSRDKLTPEFFECSGALYKSFFCNFVNGRWIDDVIYLQTVDEIFKEIQNASSGRTVKTNMENTLKHGYYTLDTYNTNDNFDVMYKLSEKICSGMYGALIINTSKEEFENIAPSNLKMAISLAVASNHMKLNFTKEG